MIGYNLFLNYLNPFLPVIIETTVRKKKDYKRKEEKTSKHHDRKRKRDTFDQRDRSPLKKKKTIEDDCKDMMEKKDAFKWAKHPKIEIVLQELHIDAKELEICHNSLIFEKLIDKRKKLFEKTKKFGKYLEKMESYIDWMTSIGLEDKDLYEYIGYLTKIPKRIKDELETTESTQQYNYSKIIQEYCGLLKKNYEDLKYDGNAKIKDSLPDKSPHRNKKPDASITCFENYLIGIGEYKSYSKKDLCEQNFKRVIEIMKDSHEHISTQFRKAPSKYLKKLRIIGWIITGQYAHLFKLSVHSDDDEKKERRYSLEGIGPLDLSSDSELSIFAAEFTLGIYQSLMSISKLRNS